MNTTLLKHATYLTLSLAVFLASVGIALAGGASASLKVNGSDGPLNVAAGTTVNLQSTFQGAGLACQMRAREGATTVWTSPSFVPTSPTSPHNGSESQTYTVNTDTVFELWCFTAMGTGGGILGGTPALADSVQVNIGVPVMTVSPTALSYGNVQVGASSDLTFTVTNTGAGTLTVNANPVISGAFAGSYSCISATCGSAQSIDATKSRTYTIRYSPTAVSNGQTASLALTGTFNQNVSLTGNGVPVPPPKPTANFTSPLAVTINKGDTTDLKWSSTDADPNGCKIEEIVGGTLTGVKWTSLPPSGTQKVSPTVDASYTVSCSNSSGYSADSPDVNVTVVIPPPTLSLDANGASPLTVAQGTSVTLNWTVADADNGCSAGGDWSGAKTSSDGTYSENLGALVANNYTFSLDCSNAGGSTIESVDVTVTPPPTADLKARVNGGPWTDGPLTGINPSDSIELQWSSTHAGTCTGTNFNTSGATSNPGMGVTEPSPGSSLTYGLDCDGATDSITASVNQEPNLTGNILSESPSTTYDPATGNFTYVDLQIGVDNNDASTGDSFTVRIEVDPDGFGSGSPASVVDSYVVGALSASGPGSSDIRTRRLNNIPFGGVAEVRITIDSNNNVLESNEGDNVITETIGGGVPDITFDLQLDPSELVRGGGNVDIDWDTVVTFPMDCTVRGPALTTHTFDPSVDGPTGSLTAGPITSKSMYTLECTERITGTDQVFTVAVSVETTGYVQEI